MGKVWGGSHPNRTSRAKRRTQAPIKYPKLFNGLPDLASPIGMYKADTFLLSAFRMATNSGQGRAFYRQRLPGWSLHLTTSQMTVLSSRAKAALDVDTWEIKLQISYWKELRPKRCWRRVAKRNTMTVSYNFWTNHNQRPAALFTNSSALL